MKIQIDKLYVATCIRMGEPSIKIKENSTYYFLESVSYGRTFRVVLFEEGHSYKGSDITESLNKLSNRAYDTLSQAMLVDDSLDSPSIFYCTYNKAQKLRQVSIISLNHHPQVYFNTQYPLIYRLLNDIPIDRIPCYLDDLFKTNKAFYNLLVRRISA